MFKRVTLLTLITLTVLLAYQVAFAAPYWCSVQEELCEGAYCHGYFEYDNCNTGGPCWPFDTCDFKCWLGNPNCDMMGICCF